MALKANLVLSATVALVGISAPIALSFILKKLLNATNLQAFAAGAALCSTSLGTTFTILSTSGLTESRLGVVLTSAAMMDDVIGLVMVQVISSLGHPASGFSATDVIRPVFVSVAFAVVLPLVCWLVVRPVTAWYLAYEQRFSKNLVGRQLRTQGAALVVHTLLLIAMVTGASYAGTSNLFAAYLAGASISWWDSLKPTLAMRRSPTVPQNVLDSGGDRNAGDRALMAVRSSTIHGTAGAGAASAPEVPRIAVEPNIADKQDHNTVSSLGSAVYEEYYGTAVKTILKPFFFVSFISSTTNIVLIKRIGIDRFLNPHYGNFLSSRRLARDRILGTHDTWQGVLWNVSGEVPGIIPQHCSGREVQNSNCQQLLALHQATAPGCCFKEMG